MQPARVLLVEDDPATLNLVTLMLTKIGCKVEVARNGKEAVEKYAINAGDYDVIFMDILMPEMDGIEAAKAIREKGFSAIPIIALTASLNADDVEKYREAGIDDFVAKPFHRKIVHEVLEKWAKNRVIVGDLSTLSMKAGLLEGEYLELLRLFVKTSFSNLQLLQSSIECGDREGLERAVHSLKGGALNFEFERLLEIAEDVKMMVLTDQLKEASEAIEELKQFLTALSRLAGQ
jgi:CheY-like chemotaxis protein